MELYMPMTSTIENIKTHIRNIPDFPKPGLNFKDITPILQNSMLLKETSKLLAYPFMDKKIDFVAGIESRGFIFGSIMAAILNAGFIPIRKPNKLPYSTFTQIYETEYNSHNILQIHRDAFSTRHQQCQAYSKESKKKPRILIHDDVLATGGSILATSQLIQNFDVNIVGYSFLIELAFLSARKRVINLVTNNPSFYPNYKISSLISYNLGE